jgi:hypothetical protein
MKSIGSSASLVLACIFCLLPLNARGQALSAEELVAKHLAAVGSPEARAAVKSRVAQGNAVFKILVGGGGQILGTSGMVSEGRKQRFLMRFQQNYRGENFLSNGDKVSIGFSNSDQSRSGLASLMYAQDAPLREGLWGGVLSTGWPLLDVPGRQPRLTYDGLKKVDGRDLHRLTYQPRKGTDLKIQLFFEPDTFRHVMTTYLLEVGNNVGKTILDSATQKVDRTTLQERFDSFTTVDGVTLPTHWTIQYTREMPSGATSLFNWDIKEDNIQQNVTLDPKNFEIK